MFDTYVSGTFDFEKSLLEGIGINVMKTGAYASWQVSDTTAFEVSEEELWFVLLDFSVLDWLAVKLIVELDSVYGRCTSFILL